MAAAIVTTLSLHSSTLWSALVGRDKPFSGSDPVVFAKTTLCTTGVTTLVWIIVTLLTAPEKNEVLLKFYNKVRPQITGWKPVAAMAGGQPGTQDLGRNLLSWMLGCIMVYSMLACIGQICFGRYSSAGLLGAVAVVSAVAISKSMPKPNEWRVD
ncbi:MAG TPA: hypothetical protein VE263_10650 [Candidatus Angelobacter sp.]|nr:hypothetical protein [Candidatus Angelobacter sp.]